MNESAMLTEQTCRVFIVDDHAVARTGLRLLAEALPGVTVVGEASTGIEAVEACRTLRPDVVLMDLEMPEMDGIEATRRLKREVGDTAVLVLTVHDDDASILDAIRAGVSGFLPKSAGLDEIQAAFEALRSGGAYLSAAIGGRALDYLSKKAGEAERTAEAWELITGREREILGLLGRGLSARRIATRLGISERTVNTHVSHVYRRLGVNNRVDAVREGMRLGLIESPS